MNRKGFTLAELMAVVVIIGIIAVVGIGSYSKAVDRAQAREGLSLAHQVAAARDAYYYDNLGQPTRITNQFADLDLTLPGTAPVGNKTKWNTRNFTLTIYGSSQSDDCRVEAVSKDSAAYKITVYQEAFGSQKGADATCTSTTEDGQTICADLNL